MRSLLREYVEVESGKKANRPELLNAIHAAKIRGATLLIAKLDRLSRDVHFTSGLLKCGIKFVCVDMPDATHLTIHVLAAVAQHERERISLAQHQGSTRCGQAERRQDFGNPNGAATLRKVGDKGRIAAVAQLKEQATEQAEKLRPIIDSLHAEGFTTLEAIAKKLNDDEIETRRGGKWWPVTVANLRRRLKLQPNQGEQ